jgi:hypothetical protein
MVQTAAATELTTYLADIEDAWAKFDAVYSTLSAPDWSKRFGKEWTFADQPYHLAYFDRLLVANATRQGANLPEGERWGTRTMRELNDWNAREFARRPAGQTPQQSLDDWRASHEEVRQALAGKTDADLDSPVWFHLFNAWGTLREVLGANVTHNWSEYQELRLRLGSRGAAPRDTATHTALGFYMQFVGATLDRQAAGDLRFTHVMHFIGPGGGAWTFRTANGVCTVTEERAPDADLIMSMSPETFVKMFKSMQHPMLLVVTGQIKVKGISKMGTFGKLFHEPGLDDPFAAATAG